MWSIRVSVVPMVIGSLGSIPTCLKKQVDILISKNQALEILYLKHRVYNKTT